MNEVVCLFFLWKNGLSSLNANKRINLKKKAECMIYIKEDGVPPQHKTRQWQE